uniref:Glycosyltransferase n=1 Tax=Oryza punctata TaxID=4537 RepID=A0A0E0KIX6_ORYPU
MADAMDSDGRHRPLRVFFLPFFAKGHLIPMTELACRMAAARPEEVDATMVVTPANAALIATTVTRAAARGYTVHVLCYPFPDVGMERGLECLGVAPAHDVWPVYRAVDLSQTIHEALLLEHRPDAIVADVPFWWATDIAAELGVPRLTFNPVGVFPQLAMKNLVTVRSEIIRAGDAAPPVSVPGLPGKEISIPASELPNFLLWDDQLSISWDRIKASQLAGFGVTVNTFVDLEQTYCHEFSRVDVRRAYFVGPVSMSSNTAVHCGGDGNDECLRWLSTKPSRSVVYVCFGSWAYFSPQQLAVLAHPSVGAFVSHCGWNSVLTWPLMFEQFINERLVTEVVAFGARVWGGGKRSVREGELETVPAEAVTRAVAGIMARGGDGDKARARARELAERARAEVGEGGSSWRDIHCLIDDLTEAMASREPQLQ